MKLVKRNSIKREFKKKTFSVREMAEITRGLGADIHTLGFPDIEKVDHPNPQERYSVQFSQLENYPAMTTSGIKPGITGLYSTQVSAPYEDEEGRYHFPQQIHYRFHIADGNLIINPVKFKSRLLEALFG